MKSEGQSNSFLEPPTRFSATNEKGGQTRLQSDLEQIVSLAALSTRSESAIVKRLHGGQFILEASFGNSFENANGLVALHRHVMESSTLVAMADLAQEPNWSSLFRSNSSESPHRYGGVPIENDRGEVLGILAVFSPQAHEFTAEHRQSLLHLASLASTLFFAAEQDQQLANTNAELTQTRKDYDKSEAFYHSLVESLPQNILRKDLDGKFTFANQNFCHVLGKTLEQIIGRTDFDFFPSELAKKYQEDDRRVAETGTRFETTEEHQTASLEQNYVHVVKTPIYDRQGQIVGIQGIFWDVTEQRKTEKDLAFERDLLRSLLDSIPDHVYFKDQSSRFIVCSKELSDRLGLPDPEAAIGKTDFDFFSPQHAQPAYEDEQRIIKTGDPVIGKVEKEILKDGTENWVLTSKMPFRSGNGSIIGTFGVSKDVTSLIQTRQALEKAQKKYQDIFEQAVEGIFQTSPDGKYLEANPALARIYGYHSAQELLEQVTDIGKQLYVDQKRRRVFRQKMEKEGEVHEFESEIFRRDGSKIWIAETARIVKNAEGEISYYEGIVEDISERKRAEAALQLARDAALESTRLKSIFLANMSHEIRTPMNGIIGMAGLLRRTDLDDEQNHFALTIEESGLTLLRLINDILDFSKMESGKMKLEKAPFSPTSVAEGVAELLSENAQKKGLEIILRVDPTIPNQVIGDATRLRQVLNNLVGNAIKFTPHGEIQIRVTPIRKQGQRCRLRFEVSDTGIGIAPDAKRHIFKAFTQADESTTRKFGGTGLGLAISRQLIELMGGKLHVESELDKGSEFFFGLPFDRCDESQTPERSEDFSCFENQRMLIVHDNQSACNAMRESLEPMGFSCTMATSSAQARSRFKAQQKKGNPFDYMIVDLNVSGNRGLKLCSMLKDLPGGRELRKILLTPVGKKIPNRRLVECDINSIVTKPTKRAQLISSLERARMGEKAGIITPSGTPPTEHIQRPQKSSKGARILVVEDNPVNQSVALHVLKQLGHEGVAANNGLEAIAMLNQTQFPLIFMDCQMPELDGYQTTQKIREMEATSVRDGRAPTRIIAMTANAMEGDRQRCLDAGMDDYISKPIMLKAVEAVLAGHEAPEGQAEDHADNSQAQRLDSSVLENFKKLSPDDAYDPLEDLSELFKEEIPKQIKSLESALEERDAKSFSRIAHTFKGSANNIGARRLAELCQRLENWDDELENSVDPIHAIMDSIQDEAQAVTDELAKIVNERRAGA